MEDLELTLIAVAIASILFMGLRYYWKTDVKDSKEHLQKCINLLLYSGYNAIRSNEDFEKMIGDIRILACIRNNNIYFTSTTGKKVGMNVEMLVSQDGKLNSIEKQLIEDA